MHIISTNGKMIKKWAKVKLSARCKIWGTSWLLWNSTVCSDIVSTVCIRTLGEIGNANCTSFTTKLLLFAVCQMGNYTSMYVTFDRFPFDLLYHCQSKRPHHSPHNEADDISKSQLISFQPKISRDVSKIVTLLQNHKKLSEVSRWILKV